MVSTPCTPKHLSFLNFSPLNWNQTSASWFSLLTFQKTFFSALLHMLTHLRLGKKKWGRKSYVLNYNWSFWGMEWWSNWPIVVLPSLNRVHFFETPWTAAHQASLSITNSQSLLKLMSIESVMPHNHLILCHPLLLPSIFPSIKAFSNESVLCIRWPKYWSFSTSTSSWKSIQSFQNIQGWFPLGLTDLISLLSKGF